jgi:hypothetical protein
MQAACHRRVLKIKSVQSPVGLDMPQMGQFWLKSDTVLSTMFRNRVGGRRLTLFTGSVVSRSTRVALLTSDGRGRDVKGPDDLSALRLLHKQE